MSAKYFEVVLSTREGSRFSGKLPVTGSHTLADALATKKVICRQPVPETSQFTHAMVVMKRILPKNDWRE